MIGIFLKDRPREILLLLACMWIIVGCERVETQDMPAEVPEIRPGILAGYLQPVELPYSLTLLSPPPAAGPRRETRRHRSSAR